MGSWSGHTLPGSLFIVFGFVWAIKASYRYFFSNGKRSDRTNKSRCVVKFDTIEACCKIFGASFGLVIEQVLPWEPWFHVVDSKTHEFTRANNWSHSTMYSFFVLSGIVDILVIKLPKTMPHCLHHFALALAFGIEGYLFYFHTHGREELDVRLHVLLLFAIWPTSLLLIVLATLDNNDNIANSYEYMVSTKNQHAENYRSSGSDVEAAEALLNEGVTPSTNGHIPNGKHNSLNQTEWTEMHSLNSNRPTVREEGESLSKRKKIFTTQLGIAILTIVHGSWFWQIAMVLYPKSGEPWEEDSHVNIGFTTMFFTWHLLVAIFIVGTIFTIFGLISRRRRRLNASYAPLHSTEIP